MTFCNHYFCFIRAKIVFVEVVNMVYFGLFLKICPKIIIARWDDKWGFEFFLFWCDVMEENKHSGGQ